MMMMMIVNLTETIKQDFEFVFGHRMVCGQDENNLTGRGGGTVQPPFIYS